MEQNKGWHPFAWNPTQLRGFVPPAQARRVFKLLCLITDCCICCKLLRTVFVYDGWLSCCFAALPQVCCWASQRFQRLALRGWNVFFWSAPASFALISTNFCSHCLQTCKHLEMDFNRKRHYFCLASNWKCQQFELIVNLKNLQERFSVETFHSLRRKG